MSRQRGCQQVVTAATTQSVPFTSPLEVLAGCVAEVMSLHSMDACVVPYILSINMTLCC